MKGIVSALQSAKAKRAVLVGNRAISLNLDYASPQAIESFCQKCVDAALKAARTLDATEPTAADLANTSFQLEITGADNTTAIHTLRFTAPGVVPAGSVAVYRLYNPYTYEHFYVTSETEKSVLLGGGWNDEKVAWYAPESGTGVYRLFNPYTDEHYYTTNKGEADGLVDLGWRWDNDANPVFYSLESGGYGIYQLFNPYETKNTHFWTAGEEEYRVCQRQGWSGEDVKLRATALPPEAGA